MTDLRYSLLWIPTGCEITVEGCPRLPSPHDFRSLESQDQDKLPMSDKIAWSGRVIAVQPRIRLTRSFDQRSHTYLGYLIRIARTVDGGPADFRVGIGSGTHATHQLRVGDQVEG